MGIVREANDTTARVELHARQRTVSVDVSKLKLVSEKPASSDQQAYGAGHDAMSGGATPLHGAATPRYGAQTPLHGAATPRYGSETPSGARTPHGAATPMHERGDSWNPQVPNTPHDTGGWEDEQPASAASGDWGDGSSYGRFYTPDVSFDRLTVPLPPAPS